MKLSSPKHNKFDICSTFLLSSSFIPCSSFLQLAVAIFRSTLDVNSHSCYSFNVSLPLPLYYETFLSTNFLPLSEILLHLLILSFLASNLSTICVLCLQFTLIPWLFTRRVICSRTNEYVEMRKSTHSAINLNLSSLKLSYCFCCMNTYWNFQK